MGNGIARENRYLKFSGIDAYQMTLTALEMLVTQTGEYICVPEYYLQPILVFLQCLKQYVELLIQEGLETAISCPDAACPKRGHLQENEVRFQVHILLT